MNRRGPVSLKCLSRQMRTKSLSGNKSWMDFGAKFVRATTGDYLVGHDTQLDGYFQTFSRFPFTHAVYRSDPSLAFGFTV